MKELDLETHNTVIDPQMAVKLLKSFFQIAKVINIKRINYSRRMDKILWIILDYLAVEQGSIMAVEKRNKLVVHAASRRELVGVEQSIAENSIASWVAKSRTPLFIPDISKDDRFKGRSGDVYKTRSLLSVPIVNDDRLLGVINVTDKAGQKNLLKDDITYLLEFSSLILSLLVQQKLHDELKKQKNTLKKRNKELRRQEKLRAELSKMLIHDLKAPLSEVVANLDILSYVINGKNKEFLSAAQISCDQTVRMVSNLGMVDKIEDGKIKLIKEKVAPNNLIEESLSSVKGLAKIKNVKLVLQPAVDPPLINLDRVLILRVLQNLITNALSYSSPGTDVSLGCEAVAGKRRLRFFVRDQGPGIPADKQVVIFEKYARISGKQDGLVGTGLGLYFCKLAVETHRGEIGVYSKEGKGSNFYFTLPL